MTISTQYLPDKKHPGGQVGCHLPPSSPCMDIGKSQGSITTKLTVLSSSTKPRGDSESRSESWKGTQALTTSASESHWEGNGEWTGQSHFLRQA